MSERRSAPLAGRIALAVALVGALPTALGATVESRTVDIEIGPHRVIERESLTVRIDDGEDLDRWALYAVALDENRELLDFDATVTHPDGDRQTLKRRDRDRLQASDSSVLHTSQTFEVIEPTGLEIGSRLTITHRVATEPWFTSGLVGLDVGDAVESIEISVRSTGAGPLRVQLTPAATSAGLDVATTEQSLEIHGSFDPEAPPDLATSDAKRALVRYAWGQDASWDDLGRWYAELLRTVPRDPQGMAALVAELGADRGSPRQRLDALVAFLRRKVRYVAVEVGIGGYAPSPPRDVVDRRWGDCKDKGLLLIDLLRAAGFDAHPVLIRLDDEGGIDPEFPTPLAFNHLIVAVDATPFADDAGSLPIAGGFVFIDATQTLGSAEHLHEGVQGQHALVVTEAGDGGGRLIQTPWRPTVDRQRLEVDLVLDSQGHGRGNVRLDLVGDAATGLIAADASSGHSAMESIVRRVLTRSLPGATIDTPIWATSDDGMPRFEASATIALPLGDTPRLTGVDLLPAPRQVDALIEHEPPRPASVDAAILDRRYRLRLPEASGTLCPPKERDDVTENALGRVTHSVAIDDGHIVVEHHAALHRARVESDELAELRALAVAEHRAGRRSLRLRCR